MKSAVNIIKVYEKQSLLDLAIQHTGAVENCFAIALANGLAVSDELQAGALLVIPEGVAVNNDELQYYRSRKIMPATALGTLEQDIVDSRPLGIGYMEIGKDFIAS